MVGKPVPLLSPEADDGESGLLVGYWNSMAELQLTEEERRMMAI